MWPLLEWGIPIIEWFQGLGDSLLQFMQFFSFLGTENFYLLVLPILFWCYDIGFGIRIGLLLLTSASVNSILKLAIGWPRPYWVSDKIIGLSSETSYGPPSGHAQNSLALWGRIASLMQNRWIVALCVMLTILISISRIYLGVHFPASTLLGWGVAGILLFIFIRLEVPVLRWLRSRSVKDQALLASLLSFTLLGAGLLVSAATSSRTVPTEWVDRAAIAKPEAEPISPKDIDSIVSSAAVVLGIGVGGVFLNSWGRFSAGGPFQQRVLRYVVGVIGVVVIFFGLRWVFPTGPLAIGQILRFVRYTVVGFWVVLGAPWLFVKLKLA